MNPKTKNILIGTFVFIIVVGFIVFFFGNSENSSNGLSSSLIGGSSNSIDNLSNGVQVADEFLVTLLNLRTLNLDNSLFEDQTFKNLEDSTINITQPGNEGRTNPFAPIGNEFKSVQSISNDFIFNQSVISE